MLSQSIRCCSASLISGQEAGESVHISPHFTAGAWALTALRRGQTSDVTTMANAQDFGRSTVLLPLHNHGLNAYRRSSAFLSIFPKMSVPPSHFSSPPPLASILHCPFKSAIQASRNDPHSLNEHHAPLTIPNNPSDCPPGEMVSGPVNLSISSAYELCYG